MIFLKINWLHIFHKMYKRPHFFLQPKHKFSFHQMIDDAIIRDHPQFVYPISSVSKVVLTNLSTHHHVQFAPCSSLHNPATASIFKRQNQAGRLLLQCQLVVAEAEEDFFILPRSTHARLADWRSLHWSSISRQ